MTPVPCRAAAGRNSHKRKGHPVKREETLRAAAMLSASPAATWIGNKISADGQKLMQVCTRCGEKEELELPTEAVKAFQAGSRGEAVAALVPVGFDEKLFTWKREFQRTHEGCGEDRAA